MLRLGVLVSGRGTNLQALLDACASPGFPAEVVLVGCNRAGAAAITRAAAARVPVCLVDRTAIPSRAERQRLVLRALREGKVELVVLAGFDEILLSELIQAFANRIINTHPSLLPAFGGTMHAVEQALAHGVKVSGCTVHLVTDQLDGGPILFQRCVEVRDDDDVGSLHARIREQEHSLLPEVVRAFAEGRVRLDGNGRARVIGSSGSLQSTVDSQQST
ncbi:MAG TPA: phosphoribosylglycinamide formyltransferase [Chloroflexota bacterium]|jgi:phosphoribosylglycinamide formyltransferase-1|nr:phosphoribosylglycinamide formyltransferase [Chloroflexota bacterium]